MNIIFITLVLSLSCLGWSWDGGWDSGDINGVNIKLDASSFSGNLDSTVTDVQLLANAVDILVSGGAINWDDPAVVAAIAAQVGWTKGTGKVYTSTDTDNVGIGTLLPTSKLSVTSAGTNANAMSNTGSDLFVKGNIEFDGKIYGDGSALSNLPASMTYPSAGIAVSTGSAWGTPITDASTNWNTAYTDRLKWDGGSTGLTAATGRTSLGLVIGTDVLAPNGSAASLTSFPTLNQNTTGSAATLTTARTINGVSFNGSANITVPSDITPGTSGNVLTSNGSVWTSAAPSGGISGLTANYIPKATSATAIGNGTIYDNGNIGIGTSVPSARLNVIGSGSTTGMTLSTRNSALTSTLVVMDNGNVGIGTTAPVAKLQVVGGGNVGINTTVPRQQLEVVGSVYATGYIANGNVGISTTAPTTCGCKQYTNGLCTTVGTCS